MSPLLRAGLEMALGCSKGQLMGHHHPLSGGTCWGKRGLQECLTRGGPFPSRSREPDRQCLDFEDIVVKASPG